MRGCWPNLEKVNSMRPEIHNLMDGFQALPPAAWHLSTGYLTLKVNDDFWGTPFTVAFCHSTVTFFINSRLDFSFISGWMKKNHRLFSLIHPPEKCWGDLASESGSHEKLKISATHCVTWCWIMEGVEPCKEGCNVLQLCKLTIIQLYNWTWYKAKAEAWWTF